MFFGPSTEPSKNLGKPMFIGKNEKPTVENEFEAWRRQRQAGERIPESLWRLAVRLVPSYGISRTAGALRVDYYSLTDFQQWRVSKYRKSSEKPWFSAGLFPQNRKT